MSDTSKDQSAMGPRHPRLSTPWREHSSEAARETVARLDKMGLKLQGFDDPVASKRVLSLRTAELTFYPGFHLYEIIQPQRFGLGLKVRSFLLKAGGLSDDVGAKPTLLNGTSPPIHEHNAKAPPEFDTTTQRLDYLKFFCWYVTGEEGGFIVVEEPDDLVWNATETIDAHPAIPALVAPAVDKGRKDDGDFAFDVTICYARHLFKAQMVVKPGGMVEMTDDDPLVKEPLPLKVNKVVDGNRVIADSTVR